MTDKISYALGIIGPAGVILVVLAFVSLYFSIRNAVYLWLVERGFRKFFDRIENTRADYARNLCAQSDNPLVNIIAAVVNTHAAHSADLRAEVAYLFHRNFEGVNKGLTYLKLITVVSPLLGLLGTMFGMVKVFRVVAAQAAPDQALLAGGIWEALITTIQGLCVAIPTMVFSYWLGLKMKGFRIEAIEHSYRAVELFGVSCDAPELADARSSVESRSNAKPDPRPDADARPTAVRSANLPTGARPSHV